MNQRKFAEGRGSVSFIHCYSLPYMHNAQRTVGAQRALRCLPAYHASGTGEGLSTSSSAVEDAEDRQALSHAMPIGQWFPP